MGFDRRVVKNIQEDMASIRFLGGLNEWTLSPLDLQKNSDKLNFRTFVYTSRKEVCFQTELGLSEVTNYCCTDRSQGQLMFEKLAYVRDT